MAVETKQAVEIATVEEAAGPSTIARLLDAAIQKGVPVESLERLQLLYERMTDRQAAQEFAAALSAFQSECPPILKRKQATIATRSGGSFAYKFADLDDIARTIRPLLKRWGFSYSWDSVLQEKRLICTCTMRHINGHIATATFELPVENTSAMSDQQKHTAALSYARRQSLIMVAGLTTTDQDTDAVDPTVITDEQAGDLEALLQDRGIKIGRFLKWANVTRVADLPARLFEEAIHKIEQHAGATP